MALKAAGKPAQLRNADGSVPEVPDEIPRHKGDGRPKIRVPRVDGTDDPLEGGHDVTGQPAPAGDVQIAVDNLTADTSTSDVLVTVAADDVRALIADRERLLAIERRARDVRAGVVPDLDYLSFEAGRYILEEGSDADQ